MPSLRWHFSRSYLKVWEVTMPQAKKPSKRKHRACAVPLLGAAGLSLSLASGASAATVGPAAHEITLGEEEISDVSLATFYVFDKENPSTPGLQLVRHGGCHGCHGCHRGCHHGCGGCHHGCGGCHHGCGGCHHGCGGCHGCHGCGGCWWWGGCGGCGGCVNVWLRWGY